MNSVRTCVGCGQTAYRSKLLRVVLSGKQLISDSGAKLSGRGSWIHNQRSCLDRAVARNAFNRAFKTGGQLDATNLISCIEQAEKMLANK